MNRVFAVMLIATACVVGFTPSFALGGVVHLLARGEAEHGLDSGTMRNPTTRFGAAPPTSSRFRKPHYGATRGTGRGTRPKRASGAKPIFRVMSAARARSRADRHSHSAGMRGGSSRILGLSGGDMIRALPHLSRSCAEPFRKPIEIEIHHRRRKQCQRLADEEAADHGIAERLADLRAGAGAQHQRHAAEQSRHGGHHDRTKAQ